MCSHEQWDVIYARIAELIGAHRTTLVFVNTRKMAERLSARLAERLGEDKVTCHHGSLARARRLDAEERLKTGQLRALVATASLELGIDIGDVDLAVQIGSTRSIATFLQRMGRAGHGPNAVPKGRLFPLTIDELAEAEALLLAVDRRTARPHTHPAGAARHPGPAGRRRLRAGAVGRARALRRAAARVAVPRPDARGLRRRRGAPHAAAGSRFSTATA